MELKHLNPQPWERSRVDSSYVFVHSHAGCSLCVFEKGTHAEQMLCTSHHCQGGVWMRDVDAVPYRLEET